MLKPKKQINFVSYISMSIILIVVMFFGVIDLRSHFVSHIDNQDKCLHFFTFFALVFITRALFSGLSVYKIALALLSFSLVLEILQELFTHGLRHFHLSDILANVLGISLAVIIVQLINRHKTQTSDS